MLDEIIEIIELDNIEMIDIEVSGNHYFFANDILTHNSDSNFDMDAAAESFGVPQTADLMWAVIQTDELIQLGQYMFKQLKNRYGNVDVKKKFVVGVDKLKMRLYNVDDPDEGIYNETTVFDNTDMGRLEDSSKKKFSGLLV